MNRLMTGMVIEGLRRALSIVAFLIAVLGSRFPSAQEFHVELIEAHIVIIAPSYG